MELNDRPGHSAEVRMRLTVGPHSLGIAQLAPDYLILHEPHSFPPSDGEISLVIDGSKETWRVRLPEGARSDVPKVRIESV